ncbi:hypothetical protein LCGC14_0929020 [marine sediment metagenome]|uniref:Uncharacterized protein n=1 Tax=marine sediment metagenome TaxID=412755 RepID=A0A0F9R6Z5_9ZZZZ
MGIISEQVKQAFDNYRQDGDLQKFAMKLVCDADDSVRFGWQMGYVCDAIREHCPKPSFECVFYNGENGNYHLFDFDPNLISRKSLLIEVRSHLRHECHIDPDGIDKAMQSVYLLSINTLVKVVTE